MHPLFGGELHSSPLRNWYHGVREDRAGFAPAGDKLKSLRWILKELRERLAYLRCSKYHGSLVSRLGWSCPYWETLLFGSAESTSHSANKVIGANVDGPNANVVGTVFDCFLSCRCLMLWSGVYSMEHSLKMNLPILWNCGRLHGGIYQLFE